jgi:hypothetical protein
MAASTRTAMSDFFMELFITLCGRARPATNLSPQWVTDSARHAAPGNANLPIGVVSHLCAAVRLASRSHSERSKVHLSIAGRSGEEFLPSRIVPTRDAHSRIEIQPSYVILYSTPKLLKNSALGRCTMPLRSATVLP